MRADERDEFDAFVRARLPDLLRFGQALTGSQHAAADLVQDALERTLLAWSRVESRHEPEGYVRRIMVNRNISIDVDNLYVSQAMVDLGPTKHRRRRRPAPMGRAYSERRWRCHLTIEVSTEKPRAVVEREERQARGKASAAAAKQ